MKNRELLINVRCWVRRWISAAAIVVTATLAFALVPGCNTMEGAGKDVESAGESVQDAAN